MKTIVAVKMKTKNLLFEFDSKKDAMVFVKEIEKKFNAQWAFAMPKKKRKK